MSSYRPPPGVVNEGKRWVIPAIAAVIVLAAIFAGGWKLHWWLAGSSANHQAHIIREGYSNQQTLREQVTQQIGNVDSINVQIAQSAGDPDEISALKSQRIAVVNVVCQDASEVTGDPLPAEQGQWVSTNCQAGVIRPGSHYDTPGN